MCDRSRANHRLSVEPALSTDDSLLISLGEYIDLDRLQDHLLIRDDIDLLDQVRRIGRYRRWHGRTDVQKRERCLYVMCLIMAIFGTRRNLWIVRND